MQAKDNYMTSETSCSDAISLSAAIFMRDFDPEQFPKHEPEPDSPDPEDPGAEDDTADLVRPIKT